MPRPVDAEKRLAILEAAAAAFLDKGYDGTTVDVVADIAGAARRTVYHQFGSKDGLFDAVVEHLWAGLLPERRLEIDNEADGLAHVRRIATHIADFWSRPIARSFLRLAIVEGPRVPQLLESYFRKGKLPVFAAISRHLADLGRSGRLDPSVIEDPDLATHQLVGLINEALLWPQMLGAEPPSGAERVRVADAAAATFMARFGLRP